MRKNIIQPSIALVILFALPATLSAWTDPSAAPPSSNASAPVNIGTSDQVKNGGLSLNSLAIFGNTLLSGTTNYLNFGTVAGVTGYGVRNNSGIVEAKSSGASWGKVFTADTEMTQTRDNAGLRGDAGARSGFFQTSAPVNYPTGASSWWHLIEARHTNTANNYALQIAGSFFDQNLYFRKVNNVTTTAWNKVVSENTSGDVTITHNVTAAGYFHSSDERLKTNVKTSSGISLIEKLHGVTFDWKKDGAPSAGVIAQEVEQVLPSAVHTSEDGIKSVEYDQLIAPLIEAVKEQQAEIESLRHEIEILKTNH
ncbi:MAG: hypothetical protein RLZZ342_445 [Candidatus Parcubacteria bacterium]|jgi:hypothetical protein